MRLAGQRHCFARFARAACDGVTAEPRRVVGGTFNLGSGHDPIALASTRRQDPVVPNLMGARRWNQRHESFVTWSPRWRSPSRNARQCTSASESETETPRSVLLPSSSRTPIATSTAQSITADLLVAGIEHEIPAASQGSLAPGRELRVQLGPPRATRRCSSPRARTDRA